MLPCIFTTFKPNYIENRIILSGFGHVFRKVHRFVFWDVIGTPIFDCLLSSGRKFGLESVKSA